MAFKRLFDKSIEPKPVIACAHDGCADPAILSRRLKKAGWANLCASHNRFHIQEEANEFCRENGLTTRAEQAQFVLQRLKTGRPRASEHWLRVSQMLGLPGLTYRMAGEVAKLQKREPGQDDEERAT